MLRHLAQRAGLAASLAAVTLVLTTSSSPLAIAADADADADADAQTPPPPPPSSGKRLSPAAQAAAILMERRRRKEQEEAEAAAAKAAAEAAAKAAATTPPPPLLPLEPCPERACRGAQDMLAAFAEVRARLKQQQQKQEQEEQQQQKTSPANAPYLWWAEALPDTAEQPPTPPCPPDTAELGRAAWTVLHSVAAYYPEKPSQEDREALRGLVHGLARLYPCAECRSHLPAELKAADEQAPRPMLKRAVKEAEDKQLDDDATSSRLLAERWMCELHNAVSVRLGKPPYDCARVGERWRDGWRDGSCG